MCRIYEVFDIEILLSKYKSYHKCTTSLMCLVDPNVCWTYWPWWIDPHIGIMVKTPKPIQMVMLGPENYRFGHIGPDLVYGDDIHKCLEYL